MTVISITCSHPDHEGEFEELGQFIPNPRDYRPPVTLPDGRTVAAAAEGYICADCAGKKADAATLASLV